MLPALSSTDVTNPSLDDITKHVSEMFTTPQLADPFPALGTPGFSAWDNMTNGAEPTGSGARPARQRTLDPMNGFNLQGWESKYSNAKIPSSALAFVGNTKFLMEPHAAAAMTAMIKAARADGVVLSIGNSYRDYATQAYAYTHDSTPSTPTAPPGQSNHGWGLAVDFIISAENHAWLVANASRFGYTNPFGNSMSATENWHWEYGQNGFSPSYGTTTAGAPAGASGTPNIPQPEPPPLLGPVGGGRSTSSPLPLLAPAVMYGTQPDLAQVITKLKRMR